MKRPIVSDALLAKWIRMYTEKGMGCRKIANAMHNDYCKSTIYRHIKRSGVVRKPIKKTFDISQFIRDYNDGISCEQMAEKHMFSDAQRVREQVDRLRLKGYALSRPKYGKGKA